MIPLRQPKFPEPKNSKPNVTFGISTDGEIFVDVGGTQYTPDANFYKQIAHQTAILAHQVVELDKENMSLKRENKKLTDITKKMRESIFKVHEQVEDASTFLIKALSL